MIPRCIVFKRQIDNIIRNFYSDFPTNMFKKEPRYFCYDLSLTLIQDAKSIKDIDWYKNEKTTQAILLLLYCWNFAAKSTKQLTHRKVRQLLSHQKENLSNLENISLLDDWIKSRQKIKKIYCSFRDAMGQTGASKALSLLNPSLFIMWDTAIRYKLRSRLKLKNIGDGREADNYIAFLEQMKDISYKLKLHDRIESRFLLAKKLDEFHYVKFVMQPK